MHNNTAHARVRQQGQQRLRMTYRLEFKTGVIERELPFVIGVLADIIGNSRPPLPKFRDRRWIEIHPDSFDAVLAVTAPGLRFEVADRLADGNVRLQVELRFTKLSDFGPEAAS